jgi:hypothetical protein
MVGEITPSEHVDVVVVGARVAGSTVAALLGDSGAQVLLVDRASFPSPTLSTHFFRGGQAVSVFDRLGVLDRLLGLGAPPLRCEYTYVGDPAGVVGPPQDPGEIGFSLSVRREALDELQLPPGSSWRSVRGSMICCGATAASSASSWTGRTVDVPSAHVS